MVRHRSGVRLGVEDQATFLRVIRNLNVVDFAGVVRSPAFVICHEDLLHRTNVRANGKNIGVATEV